MVWRLGISDWDLWHSLPNYERSHTIEAYRFEQADLEWFNQSHPDNQKHRIRSYREACPGVDEEVMKDLRRRADEMAKQLSADWSANRPPSIFTYDNLVAGMVSLRLGRRIEAIKPGEGMVELDKK